MKVFITGPLPVEAIKYLKDRNIKVTVYKNESPLSEERFIKEAKSADGLITLLSNKIDAGVIDAMKNCRVIANYAVGFNNIDIAYARQKGITVTNTPDVLTDATADLAFTLVLACARNVRQGEKLVRSGKFKGWRADMLKGVQLRNKTFGIIGAGRIGQAVALRAKAFGCRIVYYSRSKKADFENEAGAKKLSLESLLKKSDIISLHLPLNDDSYHLLDKKKLSLMKKTVILVNTARGEVVDEKALIDILKKKRLFSAGFDVYENEPLLNPELFELENAVLMPHLGSATFDARLDMAMLAAKNIAAVLSGKKPLTPVN
jgi:glyoxylate reductase